MLDIIAKPVEALVSGVVGWFTSRQKLKEVELQSKIEVAKARAAAKIDLYKSGVVGDIAWEKDSLDNSGWKDEFLDSSYLYATYSCLVSVDSRTG